MTHLADRDASYFLGEAKTARAAIILFDQIPRNIYRDTARAFAFDHIALAVTREVMKRDWDRDLGEHERQFIMMPLMHSETLSDQETCVAYFAKHLPDSLSYARGHYEMIARFGRFPHRNKAKGRETTPEEQAAIDEGYDW